MHLWQTAPRPVGLYSPHSPDFPPDRFYTGSRQLPADLHRPFPAPLYLFPCAHSPFPPAWSFRLVARSAATCSRWFFARGFSTLKMEAIPSSETSVQSTTSTRRQTPEDGFLHSHRRENLKSYI
jgi:hypothetical protein